jgi:hypothetical protein
VRVPMPRRKARKVSVFRMVQSSPCEALREVLTMLQAFRSEIRFAVAVLGGVFVLGSPPRAVEAQVIPAPAAPEAPARDEAPPRTTDTTAAPQIQVKSVSPAEVVRGGWVTISVTLGEKPITDPSVRIYLDGKPGGTARRGADSRTRGGFPDVKGPAGTMLAARRPAPRRGARAIRRPPAAAFRCRSAPGGGGGGCQAPIPT